jgi:hypothetical protein
MIRMIQRIDTEEPLSLLGGSQWKRQPPADGYARPPLNARLKGWLSRSERP